MDARNELAPARPELFLAEGSIQSRTSSRPPGPTASQAPRSASTGSPSWWSAYWK